MKTSFIRLQNFILGMKFLITNYGLISFIKLQTQIKKQSERKLISVEEKHFFFVQNFHAKQDKQKLSF